MTILVDVAFDEHPLSGFIGFTFSCVLSKLSERVGLGTEKKCVLCCFNVLWTPSPCLQARVLECSGVGERHVPWVRRLVHRVQVQRCFNLRLSTGQKLHNTTLVTAWTNVFFYQHNIQCFCFSALTMIPGTAGGILLWRSLRV